MLLIAQYLSCILQKIFIFLAVIILAIECSSQTVTSRRAPHKLLAGQYPTPGKIAVVDSNAPLCKESESCGFYLFDKDTYRPLKWIPSWCRCEENMECVYQSHNEEMKVYRHACRTKTDD